MDIDILCKCGHLQSKHQFENTTKRLVCIEVMERDGDNEFLDKCLNYIPDNLGHIEALAKERKLI